MTARPDRQQIRHVLDRYLAHEQLVSMTLKTRSLRPIFGCTLTGFRLSSKQVQHTQKDYWNVRKALYYRVNLILDGQQLAPAEQLDTLINCLSPKNFLGSRHTFLDHMYLRVLCAARPEPIGT